jgi:hypothetical protein
VHAHNQQYLRQSHSHRRRCGPQHHLCQGVQEDASAVSSAHANLAVLQSSGKFYNAYRQVRLPITFGTRDNYRTKSLDFNVAYIALPYNTILGYPALARFMAATHHGFNVLKIPSANGTIIVRCNEKDALRSMEHVYREAATMFPADEDLLEHSGDLARKKQLVSQKRAAAK